MLKKILDWFGQMENVIFFWFLVFAAISFYVESYGIGLFFVFLATLFSVQQNGKKEKKELWKIINRQNDELKKLKD